MAEPGPDCSALLDEELSSFVFNYLTDSQYEVSGEEHLYSDFPEIDLSQLDAGDFDSASCFNELQWCCEHSETESSQYSTDDSELFQIIDSENEALLAALTETLDDIQGDDMGLAAFRPMDEGDMPNSGCTSLTPSPKPAAPLPRGPPLAPEVDELSLVEGVRDRKPSFLQAQSRSCTELHKHLTSITAHCPHTKDNWPPDECHSGGTEPQSYCAHHGEDSDSGEELLPCGNMAATPPSSSEEGTGEKELHATVELIRYMHTYCLPPRKLPPTDLADARHQHFHSPSKRAKAPAASFSILKELLARDLPCDVSKPYRLAKPAYASLTRLQPPKAPGAPPPEAAGGSTEACKSAGRMPPEVKTEPRQGPKAEPEVKEETGSPAEEEEDCAKRPQLAFGKAGRKQESFIYAVRRSKRLNPELSLWLSFLDDSPPDPATPPQNKVASPELSLCSSTLQNFDREAPAAEVEVSGAGEAEDRYQSLPMELQTPSPESSGESEACEISESQLEIQSCLCLSLSQKPTFGKRNFEQVLTVELCGTAGLTPPTTPPYKPSEEDLYKPDIHQRPAKETAIITSSEPQPMMGDRAASGKKQKKHPVRTELYAHLSRSTPHLPHPEPHGVLKRPFSRSFGDHDYCQVLKPEASLQRKVLKSWEPLSHVENKHKRRAPDVHYQHESQEGVNGTSVKEGSQQLRDQEIRASLTKHFGLLDSALDAGEAAFCKTPEYDTVFEDSCSEIGSPLEEEEEEEEEEECCTSPLESKMCPYKNPLSRASLHYCSRSRSDSESSCCRSRSPASRWASLYENGKQCQDGTVGQMEKRREKAIGEGRVVYIRNLASSMSSTELKKRFEVFGEIVECCVLTRNKRGDKYGFITYRCSEHAALSLKNGASLRKRNEPLFQLSYGGFGHFFWTRYTDLDSNTEESSPALIKSKYETMDFDSLLQEAQESLHR
uniref:PPARG coactivator 1 beta n=1 Tax=Podarcis muralis TaxID=64176 RepID=A0A670JF93_PODMU